MSTRQARDLNDRADKAAVAATTPVKPAFDAALRQCRNAADWAELAVRRQARLTHDWHEAVADQSRVRARV